MHVAYVFQVYCCIERSLDVFLQLAAQRHCFSHKARELIDTVQRRRERYALFACRAQQPGPPPLHVLVLGGGPIGLRTACEMALLGHHVSLLESRDAVTRWVDAYGGRTAAPRLG